jgi:hypothetical protein
MGESVLSTLEFHSSHLGSKRIDLANALQEVDSPWRLGNSPLLKGFPTHFSLSPISSVGGVISPGRGTALSYLARRRVAYRTKLDLPDWGSDCNFALSIVHS